MPPPISLRFAVLLELLRSGPLRATDLTTPTDITVQGVSYHLKQLESEGLVTFEDDGRRAKLTPAGIEALHDHFLGLKAFVDLALTEMLPVEECVALAAEPIAQGAVVGLFMENGRLTARKDHSPSSGRARAAAREGELVVVTGLTGVVELHPGTVHVVTLPPAATLPPPSALADQVQRAGIRYHVLAAAGLEAELYAERAYLTRLHPLNAHAGAHVARSAAQRGLDALLVVSNENVNGILQVLRDTSAAAGPAVEIKVHEM